MGRLLSRGCLALVGAALVAPGTVLAFDGPRPYLSADLGAAFVDLDGAEDDLRQIAEGSVSTDERSFGFVVGGGVRFGQYFALEANYFDLGEFEASLDADSGGRIDDSIEISGYGLRGIGHWPVARRWSLNASGGISRLSAKRDIQAEGPGGTFSDTERETDYVVTLGVGVQYDVARQWALRAQFLHFDSVGDSETTGEDDVQMATLGGLYRF